MADEKEFDELPDAEKFKALREELWAPRAEIVSLGGVEGKLTREIEALKARLAEIENRTGGRGKAPAKRG